VNWEVSVDSSVIRAHQHAAGARKKRAIRRLRSRLAQRCVQLAR
jgi:hypothetical protein